jgi:heme-degrading monooxygenase HmoA
MYMRVTRTRIDPAKMDEAITRTSQDIAAAARRLPGFQSLLLGADRATGQSIAVSTWDTEEHARWSRDALGDIPSRLQALGVQVDPPEIFEVTTT